MRFLKKIFINYWPLLLLLFAVGSVLTASLPRELLSDWDECLYGQYTKEMRSSGHYLTNIWNGYHDMQKPPLYTWLLQIPTMFGLNEFNLRILSVLSGLGLIAALYVFSKKYFSTRIAILASLILCCGELIIIYSRRINTDIHFVLFIFLAFWLWVTSSKKSRLSYLSGLFFGLAVMVKGLGSIQFLAAIFASIFLNFSKQKVINFIKVGLVFSAVIIPWHLAAYGVYGAQFIKVYFLENIIKRSKYPIEFHRERWWFYFVLLFRELRPWLFFAVVLPAGYLFSLKKYLSIKKIRAELKKNELLFTIILLIIIPLISIIRVRTKIAWYAMPIYPFLAIYLAYNIELLLKKIKLEKLFYLIVVFLIYDSGKLLMGESKILQPKQVPAGRNEAVIESTKQPDERLYYLVPFGERQARDILPPEEQIPQTWIFGGHPCAVYYSNKKVEYFYITGEFLNKLKKSKGLYLIENGDLHFIKDLPVKAVFKNNEYTLFRN